MRIWFSAVALVLSAIGVFAQDKVIRDVAYGRDPAQRFDVYVPPHAHGAPVIFMVHGGGWRIGDKALPSVDQNKVAHWVPQGTIFISTNYRMLPAANVLEQAHDVAAAIAFAQSHAAEWGGDKTKFVLMGHSAGAHIVALIVSSPSLSAHLTPWRGAVLLDSAALDVPRIMQARHLPLYDDAFGSDPAQWRAASPFHALTHAIPPILAVCSSRRADSCPQAHAFVDKALSLGTHASVLEENKSHREINVDLGADASYTAAVDGFMRELH